MNVPVIDHSAEPRGNRPSRHPPLYAWMLLAATATIALYALKPSRFEGHSLVVTPVAILVGALILRKLWDLPPAVTMCAAIVLTIFSGGWAQMGFGKLPLNRLLIVFVLMQILLRAPGTVNMPPIRIRNVHLVMCAAVLYALGSAAVAGTIGNQSSVLLIVDVFGIAPFLLFVITPTVFAGPKERNLLLAVLVGLGAYLSLTTVFESLGPHGLVFPSYIVNSDAARPGVFKPGGPFQSPVEDGFANFACAVGCAIAFMRWRGRRTAWLALAVGLLCVVGCFLTLERGVWIATPVAIAVTALCTRTGRRLLLPGALVAALVIGAVLSLSPAISQRTTERANSQQSVWERQNMTSAGLRMVAAKPLFGFGWDRYSKDSLGYFRQPRSYPMLGYTPVVTIGLPETLQPLHDTYLAYAVELGLVGLSLWLISLLWSVGGAILTKGTADLRQWKLGLLAIATFFAIVSFVDPHQLPFPVVLLMIWAGVAWGHQSIQAPMSRENEASRPLLTFTPTSV